ncbi:hypothetical protein ONE56_02985 [Vibrio mytili]|uniref:hypothetical protein n=1 Tax=Vibrio mytili TaxID=50718 RepID=UPI003C7007E0
MKIDRQYGATTLLVTSILLIVALLVTLGSYRSLFYQIKRAQNEVSARQQHWVAEGGLECIYSKALTNNAIPTSASIGDCNVNGDIEFSYTSLSARLRKITSTYGYSSIDKTIQLPGTGASGVMKATSNLYFAGGMAMRPDPGDSLGGDEWGCTMLRYSSEFIVFGALQNQGFDDAHLPYQGFPAGQNCKNESSDSYITSTSGNYDTPTNLKQDFVFDDTQKPFEDLFDTPREDWFDVMSFNGFVKIANVPLTNGSGEMNYQQSALPAPEIVSNCGTKIKNAIQSGNDLIWVYGSCHLDETDLTNIGNAITPASGASPIPSGVILVLHNGLLSTAGALDFKGMLYHFISNDSAGNPEFIPDASLWSSLDADQKTLLDGAVAPVTGIDTANTAYFQRGTFFPLGGYVMDAPGTYAVYDSSVSFSYNRDVIETPLRKLKKLKWKSGSWYAN